LCHHQIQPNEPKAHLAKISMNKEYVDDKDEKKFPLPDLHI
jgi:hypothetical protein